jgi:molybdopterin synthase sulfur carrier subunit
MKIIVKPFANFREILGRELEIELKDGSTVRDLLKVLALENERLKKEAFDESGKLKDYVLLMKNRKMVDRDSLDVPLAQGDEVAIFPPVSGG